MVSLLGLPILLVFLTPEPPRKVVVMPLRLPRDHPSSNFLSFNKVDWLRPLRNKKIEEINLDENHFTVEQPRLYGGKFRFIMHEIERINYTGDTNTVLKLNFTELSTYGDFAWLCSHMQIMGIKRYALIDDSFYILPNKR